MTYYSDQSFRARMPSEGSIDETPVGSGSPFIIKNTFIEFPEELEDQASRSSCRSSSAPPLLRRFHSMDLKASSGDELELHCTRSPRSTASTSARTDEDDEELGKCATPSIVSYDSDTCEACSPNFVNIVLADLVPERQRIALDTKAKAWRPPGAEAQVVPTNCPARQDFAAVMGAVEATLKNCAVVEAVTSSQSLSAWCIAGVSKPQHPRAVQHTLAVAKQAMLSAAERSNGVYLVGYDVKPFSPSPDGLGFVATLAYVEDENSACWDHLSRGCCTRAHRCRWQHPVKQLQARVTLAFQPVPFA